MEAKYIATILAVLALTLRTPASAETNCEVPPEPVHPHTCCTIPDMISDEMKEKCEEYLMPPPPAAEDDGLQRHPRPHPHFGPSPHPPHHKCLMSCVFNETGILNDEQKLDEEKLSEYLATVYQDDENQEVLIPALEASFKTCIVKVEEMMARRLANKAAKMASSTAVKPHHRPYPGCPMKAGFLAGCVFMETFQNCPATIWNDDDKCNTFRDYIQECRPRFGAWRKRGPLVENSV